MQKREYLLINPTKLVAHKYIFFNKLHKAEAQNTEFRHYATLRQSEITDPTNHESTSGTSEQTQGSLNQMLYVKEHWEWCCDKCFTLQCVFPSLEFQSG